MFQRRVDDEVARALLEEEHAPARDGLACGIRRDPRAGYDQIVDHVVYGMFGSEWAVRTPEDGYSRFMRYVARRHG